VDLAGSLKQTVLTEQRKRFGAGQVLVTVQIATSLLLLVAAGLFVRTLTNLNAIELGFNREHLLTFSINALQAGHRDQAQVRFYETLRQRLVSLPSGHHTAGTIMLLGTGSLSRTGPQPPAGVRSNDPAAHT